MKIMEYASKMDTIDESILEVTGSIATNNSIRKGSYAAIIME